MKQHTISIPIRAKGWDGKRQKSVQFMLNPASENSGIEFQRSDLPHRPCFTLNLKNLHKILPSLKTEYFDLATFQPLLTVLRSLQIDNILIDCESNKMPEMGSSASVLLFLVQAAGLKEQNALRRSIQIKDSVKLKVGNTEWSRLIPSNKKRIAVVNSFDVAVNKIPCSNALVDFNMAVFKSELCYARSEEDIEADASFHRVDSKRHALYSRLVKEKGQRRLFDAYSVLCLLPYELSADYMGYNTKPSDILLLLKHLLDRECINIISAAPASKNEIAKQKTIVM